MPRKERIPVHHHLDENDGGKLPTAAIAGYGPSSTVVTTAGGATALNDLSDVDTVTTPAADNDVLTYNSTTGQYGPEAAAVASYATPANTYGTPAAGAASTGVRTDAVLPGPPIVILTLTNKTGGGVVLGDVVVIDTANDTAFTTTTTGQAEVSVGIAQATIANNASGAVLVQGYAALVNVPSSMTRGRYLETHTVAKQATGSAARRAGSFGQFLTAGTTPTAWLWGQTDQTASGSGLTDPMTTRGDVIVRNASNVTARLGIGSSGKVLSSDGTDISWQTPTGGSGALILLEQHAASASATLDFTSRNAPGQSGATFQSDYDEYQFDFMGIVPATNNTFLYLNMGTGAGPTWDTTAGHYAHASYRAVSAASAAAGNTSDTKIIVDGGAGVNGISSNAANGGLTGTMRLYNPGSGTDNTQVNGTTSFIVAAGGGYNVTMLTGVFLQTTAVTGLRFAMSAGNITSGTIRIYGIAK